MKKYTTEQALEFMFEDSEDDDVGSWADDNSDGASIDSFDELDWEERIDRVLDM